MASIIVTTGDQKGESLPLGRRISVIGRAEALLLQTLDDLASRKHLRIRFDVETNRYYAEDMNSRHGVFVNKHRITDCTVLSEGDEILICRTTLLFTEKDFDECQSALTHYKKVGQRLRPTLIN